MTWQPTTTKSTLMQPSGLRTLLVLDSSPPEPLTVETFETWRLQTLGDLHNATSLLASPVGASPSDLPDGPTTDLFGQAHAPASPSLQPEKAKHQAMNATFGPTGSSLSDLADRQSSLANRLKRQLDGAGSTLFTLTWRKKATPLGRPYFQLAASGLRISDNDCGSWATTANRDYRHANAKSYQARGNHKKGEQLNNQVKHGLTFAGSPAQTESKGQLNPAFSLWLMGYPPEWLNSAPPATRLSRKSRQNSSEQAND
jgi:hypothetical protein